MYQIPNMARRLTESFLAFRFPYEASGEGQLTKLLDKVSVDEATRIRVVRFLHTYSHMERIRDPEHDLSELSEARVVLRDLMRLIEAEDPRHYAEMMRLVAGAPVAD